MTDSDERNAPAIVQGSEQSAYAVFVTDNGGNLVDILYYCRYSDCSDDQDVGDALPWPAFDFGDSGAYCDACHEMIDEPTRSE